MRLKLRLTSVASEKDKAIQKKAFGTGMTTLKISNEKMNGIIKIIKCLEESELLIKDVSKTIKKKAKEQKGGFPDMLGLVY